MLKSRSIVIIFLTFFLGLSFVHAQTIPDSSVVIVTPVPPAKDNIIEPEGYTECKTVEAGWYNGQWHSAYKACRYTTGNTAYQGEGWIAGHWACSKYQVTDTQAVCTNWDWFEGRWVKKYEDVENY